MWPGGTLPLRVEVCVWGEIARGLKGCTHWALHPSAAAEALTVRPPVVGWSPSLCQRDESEHRGPR